MLTIEKKKAPDKVKSLTKRLAELVEGYAVLVRKGGTAKLKAGDLIRQALSMSTTGWMCTRSGLLMDATVRMILLSSVQNGSSLAQ